MDVLKLATTPKILRLFTISIKRLAFSSLVLRLYRKINGFVLCSFFVAKLGLTLKKNLFKTCICANINVRDYTEYNDNYRTAYFDTMLHLRKEKTHKISL